MKKQFFRTLKPQARTSVITVPSYQFNDRIANACFIGALFVIVLSFMLVWINFQNLPPEVPLFFQRPWGEQQLAPKTMIWLQPGLLLIFFLINYALSLLTMKNEPLTARILGGTMFICSTMSIISLWNIMNLLITIRLWF